MAIESTGRASLPLTVANIDAGVAFTELTQLAEEAMGRLHVPGVALGVIAGGAEYVACLGVTSVENPLPVTEDTLFQIGSTTKTVTATVAMRLVEQGLLDLDVPIREYLPDFKLQDESVGASVTLRHLFTHVGGWAGDHFLDTGWGDDALAHYVSSMAELPQVTPMGAYFSYNNSGFCLAGRVIESATGKTYEAAVKELLFEPAGLEHSLYSPVEVLLTRFAAGHIVRNGTPQVSKPWPIPRASFPAGGIAAGIRDQLAYARLHLAAGVASRGARVLKTETIASMREPICRGDLDCWRGIAWNLETRDGVGLAFHGGSTNGQQSAFMLAPERGFAIAVLTNADRGARLNREVTDRALQTFLGVEPRRRTPIDASPGELEEYAGDYPATMGTLRISIRDGGLFLESLPDESAPRLSEQAPRPTSTRLVLTAPDRVLALDAPYEEAEAEFLRDEAGKVAFVRFGLRVRPRLQMSDP
jgi:CubicO group peptidase (beta-lactamase class C family)